MIKIFYALPVLISGMFFSQVAIGKNSISNASVSLEFGDGNKGIVLPWVKSAQDVVANGVVDGTLVFDAQDKKVKIRAKNQWSDLTTSTDGIVDISLQSSKIEFNEAKVVIGKNPEVDKTPGILVLQDSDKAMVLPKVASPHLKIVNPAAGMMVYDTDARQLAVFNGKVWTFWKP